MLDDLVEIGAVLLRLESVYATDGQHALETSVDRVGVICAQQPEREVEKPGPPLGEVMLEDLLKDGNELGADIRRR